MNTPIVVGREPESESTDLEDLLLFSMGEAVRAMKDSFGYKSMIFRGPKGEVSLEQIDQDPDSDCIERLGMIVGFIPEISIPTGICYQRVAECLFVLDGWSWNKNIFRAPIWLNDHREIPLAEARKLNGMLWIEGSSLEIKSKLRTASDVFVE